ncbi:MAG TPA: hypothetical protein VMW65_09510 [Chloroflexota bacterium]|nr:hypothetical protein [Chloroflexota bacterium]
MTMEPIDPEELARLRALPWLTGLDAGDVAQMVAEYEGALREAYRTGDRQPLDAILSTWRARAERRAAS